MGNGLSFIRRSRAADGNRSAVEPFQYSDSTEGFAFRYIHRSSFRARVSSSAPSSPSSSSDRPGVFQQEAFPALRGSAVSANRSGNLKSLANSKWHSPAAPLYKFYTPGFEGSRSFPAVPFRLSSQSNPVSPRGNRGKKWRFSTSLFQEKRFDEPLLQWAHGKAGEDRLHVVVSEEQRWLFVGIYDAFNGSVASEFLAANLFKKFSKQLEKWRRESIQELESSVVERPYQQPQPETSAHRSPRASYSVSSSLKILSRNVRTRIANWRKRKNRMDVLKGFKVKEQKHEEEEAAGTVAGETWKPSEEMIIEALTQALDATEADFFWLMSMGLDENPLLTQVGSCVLVVLIVEDNIYVMNLGDSRAVIAQEKLVPSNPSVSSSSGEEIRQEFVNALEAVQLSTDHNTDNSEEVQRIRAEHPDDANCIWRNKVKGRLQVTRAFGIGCLKQYPWNEALPRGLRCNYIGTEPYVSAAPAIRQHRISPGDKFIVISSDGLYQHLDNANVVSHVKIFMEKFPDGDPSQALINLLLNFAASAAELTGNELRAVDTGYRREFHDDVTVVVVCLDGRAWRSTASFKSTIRRK